MAEPPVSAGASKVTSAPPWVGDTAVTVGGSGSVEGVTVVYQVRPDPMQSSLLPSPTGRVGESQQHDPEPVKAPDTALPDGPYVLTVPALDSPQWLCALTSKEYVTPFVSPVTVIGDLTDVSVSPPGDAVTV
jgi:hypothetical protein